jgi:hypothetical protein
MKKNNLLNTALLYHNMFGFNVLPLKMKQPIIEWKQWTDKHQAEQDIENMPWDNATGLGAVMGIDGLCNFDLDGVSNPEIVEILLHELGLPERYPWVVQSGSGAGFHVYFKCAEERAEPTPPAGHPSLTGRGLITEKGVYKFKLKEEGYCKHIEFRRRDCQTALPLSAHASGGIYSFYYNDPNEPPLFVEIEKIEQFMRKYGEIQTVTGGQEQGEMLKPVQHDKINEQMYYDAEKLESALEYLAAKLPKGSYDEWYRIGFALQTIPEGEEYFVKFSLANKEYEDTEVEARKKFKELGEAYDGRVTIGSLYHIAEKYGWKKPLVKFWKVDDKGRVKISPMKIKRLLEAEGYCKYKLDSNYLFIRVEKNIVEEIDCVDVKEFIMRYIEAIPIEKYEGTNKAEVIDTLIRNNQLFTVNFLEFLITKQIYFNEDTINRGYFYFRNGFAEVTKDNSLIKNYSELEYCIWRKQIIERDYQINLKRPVFEEFLHNICRNDVKRYEALKSGIGYLLHNYKDPSLAKAIIFIDEKMSEGAFGRSGKGLVIKSVAQVRNTVIIDGRNFNPSKNFAFQRVKADTNILALEDINDKFPFEKLFAIITDGLVIERKNKDEIFLSFKESPKLAVSTNFTIKGIDDSTLDRQFIVEFSDYYNMYHRPVHDFGRYFFEGWDEDEWSSFDCFMIECLQFYLANGLVEYAHINLELKKLIDATSPEFIEFADGVSLDQPHDKKDLFTEFKSEYQDFEKMTQGTFTKWLKIYARVKGLEVIEEKSGSKRVVTLGKKESRAA